jgi:hypothetical protein
VPGFRPFTSSVACLSGVLSQTKQPAGTTIAQGNARRNELSQAYQFMKTQKALLKAVLFMTIGLFIAGCSTPEATASRPRRFHEASRADVVLQFSSWNYTFLIQPRYDENGFLRPVRPESIGRLLDRFNVRRDLAVVVIGWTYGPQEINRLVAEWKSVLGGCGFRRAVFLRSHIYNKLNGSLIIDDSTLFPAPAQANSPCAGAGQ